MAKAKLKKRHLKVLERLADLAHQHDAGDRRRDSSHENGRHDGNRFDEKRIIDTITRNVVERVTRVIQREQHLRDRHRSDDRRSSHRDGHYEEPRQHRRDDHRDHQRDEHRRNESGERGDGREKHAIDTVVHLLGERLHEIVRQELDERLGPASADDGDTAPPTRVARKTRSKPKRLPATRSRKSSKGKG